VVLFVVSAYFEIDHNKITRVSTHYNVKEWIRQISPLKEGIILKNLCGNSIQEHLDELSRLRIEIFKDYPYLYEGDKDYEKKYLRNFAKSQNATIIGAFKDGEMIGASTAIFS
jgi:hypothetical protein